MEKIKKIISKYFTVIKYFFSSGASFVIDIVLFTVFNLLLNNIVYATICARIISSLFNYILNRKLVFNSDANKYKSLIEYYLLVIMQMFISGLLVSTIHTYINISPTLIKVPVEVILFMINYVFQKYIIFVSGRKNYNNIYSILLSIVSVIAVVGNLGIRSNDYIAIYKNVELIIYPILLIFFFFMYNNLYKKEKLHIIYNILAFLISFAITLCASYNHISNPSMLYNSIPNILITLIKYIGFYFIIRFIIIYVIKFYNTNNKDLKNEIVDKFYKHPFIYSFIFLSICYGLYLIAFYPGILNYDNANQIKEVLGIHTRYLDAIIPLSDSVNLTNFNPVIHTMLLGNLVKLGINIGNINFGIFMYIIIQLLIVISTYSYIIFYLSKEKVNKLLLIIVLLLIGLVPVFPFYAITAVKDVIFACFLLLYSLKLYDIIKHKNESIKDYLILFILALLVILFRNNGIYDVLLSLPFMLFIVKKKLPIIILVVLLFGTNKVYQNIILPHYYISNTSIREMLSIPFQQTARYVKYYEEEISEKDKEVIENILEYDTLKDCYNEDLSDPVKNKFNRYYTKEELNKYFNVWYKGLKIRPMTYLNATINNVTGYVNPFEKDWVIYYKLNPKLPMIGYNYHYNKLSGYRHFLIDLNYVSEYTPGINILTNVAIILWLGLFIYLNLIINKKYKYLVFLTPNIVQLLICFASPCNLCFRYIYPSLLILVLFTPLINKINVTKK